MKPVSFRAHDHDTFHPASSKYELGAHVQELPFSAALLAAAGYLLPYACSVLAFALPMYRLVIWTAGEGIIDLFCSRLSPRLKFSVGSCQQIQVQIWSATVDSMFMRPLFSLEFMCAVEL